MQKLKVGLIENEEIDDLYYDDYYLGVFVLLMMEIKEVDLG